MEIKYVGRCIISSIIFQDAGMNESTGTFALFRDETRTWRDLRTLIRNKGFTFTPIGDNGDNADWEIRSPTPMTKVELYEAIKKIAIDFAEDNKISAFEDIYDVGIGSQNILTLQS